MLVCNPQPRWLQGRAASHARGRLMLTGRMPIRLPSIDAAGLICPSMVKVPGCGRAAETALASGLSIRP